jgi:putative sterol carrier protein
MLDFFLDEEENLKSPSLVSFIQPDSSQSTAQKAQPEQAAASTSSSTADVTASMNAIKGLVSSDLVKKINGVYGFNVTDANPSEWYLDLKNGNGDLGSGKFNGQVNCTLTMKSDVFNNMVTGKLKPTSAFMSGKLKIKGDMGLAMKLEKLMGSLKAKL